MFKKFNSYRSFSISEYMKQNVNKIKPNETKHEGTEIENLHSVRPKKWEKYLLMYSKRYKSVAEVPAQVSVSTLDKAKSIVRIKLSNYIMVFMAVACLGYVYIGKKRAERGDTAAKRALDYKEKYLTSFKKEEEIQK